jgi:predicted P-loop ATPase
VQLFDQGEQWWAETDEEKRLCEEQQELRRAVDAWEDRIAEHLGDKDETTISDLLISLGVEISRQSKPEQTRVGQALRALGWERVGLRTA